MAFGTCAILGFAAGLAGTIGFVRVGAHASALDRWLLMGQIAAAFGMCALAACSGMHLLRVVCGGLDRMGRKFEEIAVSLDLSKRSASPRRDEFGRAAVAFDRLMQRVESSVLEVRSAADTVAIAARELACGNLDLSTRTEQQATSLEETAASMTQLIKTVKDNADNARQAHQLASSASNVTDTGANLVGAMVDAIAAISRSSMRISAITSMIEGIAFQTNILALNAAVEAARAGVQGRGFAVVAAEVRSLAQRAASSTKEINELIASSVEAIQAGSQQAGRAATAIADIRTAIARVSGIVGEIAAASDRQSRGIEQIGQAIGEIDSVTQQNAALVEQAAAATQSLSEQGDRLKVAVASFKLAEAVH
ncbi:methyl-accepting chemotaxis protein [Trinickia acidisoli]|uniref:methyl-accepting chemotaxis protein n=1 Tax=Trinickia acidisoli TaxID=2767482 RepID=UPI001A8CA0F1|nr:methyl-accepting chemotaxis protein [Trinickia acidisoli]